MKKATFLLMLSIILSKIFGFIRDIILSNYYGASALSDAYLISITVPTFVFAMLGTGIATSFIPTITNIFEKSNSCENKINVFTSKTLYLVVIFSSIILLLVLIFTEFVVHIFASGFTGEVFITTVNFTRISIYGILFLGMYYVFSGYLNFKSNFIVPALSGVVLNIVIIITIVLSSHISVYLLPLGTVIAMFLQFLYLFVVSTKKGFKLELKFDLIDNDIKNLILMSLPIMLGTSVSQINVLVDRTIASNFSEGSISALTYANRINLSIQEILVLSLATILFPIFSKLISTNNFSELKAKIEQALINGILLLLPISVITFYFSDQIISVLFLRGEFDLESLKLTSNVLMYYAIGMLMYGLRDILSKVFYAYQETKIPTKNSIITVLLNIVLNLILSHYFGIPGLALATSITGILSTLSLWIVLCKRKISIDNLKVLKVFLIVLIVSIISVILGDLICKKLLNHTTALIDLIFSGSISVLLVILQLGIFKVINLSSAYTTIKKIMKRS